MSNNSPKTALVNVEIPDCLDKAITNLTEQPTKSIGTTFADIWYLVFGGISQSAEKRRMRYAIELERFNEELKRKIDDIPKGKEIEPDVQVVARALEASKYCVEKENLREMFSNLIASSMNSDKAVSVHPIFVDIISSLSHTDASVFKTLASTDFEDDNAIFETPIEQLTFSFAVLEQLGLIKLERTGDETIRYTHSEKRNVFFKEHTVNFFYNIEFDDLYNTYRDLIKRLVAEYTNICNTDYTKIPKDKTSIAFFKKSVTITSLGHRFKEICL